MVDPTSVIIIIGFIGVIGTTAGMFLWLDRKITAELRLVRAEMRGMQNELRAEMRESHNELRAEMRESHNELRAEMRESHNELRAEMREMQNDMWGEIRRLDRDIRVLSAKVDRAQGSLDVIVFGERGVPPSVATERAEMESRAEEAVGD